MIGIGRFGRLVLIGAPFVWFALFFLLPMLIVLVLRPQGLFGKGAV